MSKSSKSRNPEFLANRRKAIADRARKRRLETNRGTTGASAAPSSGNAKVEGRLTFAPTPTAQQ